MAQAIQLGKKLARPTGVGLRVVVLGFAAAVLAGTVLLCLPFARVPGAPFSFLTSLFTATSAVCVTGLTVVETGTYWSPFGQGVILVLFQLGGLGIMTAAVFLLIVFGRSVSLRDQFTLRETSGFPRIRNAGRLIIATVLFTIGIELLGATILAVRFHALEIEGSIWMGAFHAISAFNNAGFDLWGGGSLAALADDSLTLACVMGLMVLGGLGVIVFLDMAGARRFSRLSPQSKLILLATVGLLGAGALAIFGAEYNNPGTLGPLSTGGRIVNALFQAATARTAGFSSVPTTELRESSQLITAALMVIGGATGGTAGGIKVATFAVIVLATVTAVQGRSSIRAFGFEVPYQVVYRALALSAIYLAVIFAGVLVLSISEASPFRDILFEAFSAVGTVGLSLGLTPELSGTGQLIVMALMFTGRVGPLVLVALMARRLREPSYRLPETSLSIG